MKVIILSLLYITYIYVFMTSCSRACICHSPLFPTRVWTTPAALLTLEESATSRCKVVSRWDDNLCSRSSPFSVQQPAITLKPSWSRCLASKLPNPESHPVMQTYLSSLFEILLVSLYHRYANQDKHEHFSKKEIQVFTTSDYLIKFRFDLDAKFEGKRVFIHLITSQSYLH